MTNKGGCYGKDKNLIRTAGIAAVSRGRFIVIQMDALFLYPFQKGGIYSGRIPC